MTEAERRGALACWSSTTKASPSDWERQAAALARLDALERHDYGYWDAPTEEHRELAVQQYTDVWRYIYITGV